jgi:hypothetical protein
MSHGDARRLVGYLETIGDNLINGLIMVSVYEIGDSRLVVPQRIDLERVAESARQARPRTATSVSTTEGAHEFVASIATAREEDQADLHVQAPPALADADRVQLADGQRVVELLQQPQTRSFEIW